MTALPLKGSVLMLDDLLYIVEVFSLALSSVDLWQSVEGALAYRVEKGFIRRIFIYDNEFRRCGLHLETIK